MRASNEIIELAPEDDVFVLGEVSDQSCRCLFAEAHLNAEHVGFELVLPLVPMDEHADEDVHRALVEKCEENERHEVGLHMNVECREELPIVDAGNHQSTKDAHIHSVNHYYLIDVVFLPMAKLVGNDR